MASKTHLLRSFSCIFKLVEERVNVKSCETFFFLPMAVNCQTADKHVLFLCRYRISAPLSFAQFARFSYLCNKSSVRVFLKNAPVAFAVLCLAISRMRERGKEKMIYTYTGDILVNFLGAFNINHSQSVETNVPFWRGKKQ